jgi:hypothetical protein
MNVKQIHKLQPVQDVGNDDTPREVFFKNKYDGKESFEIVTDTVQSMVEMSKHLPNHESGIVSSYVFLIKISMRYLCYDFLQVFLSVEFC